MSVVDPRRDWSAAEWNALASAQRQARRAHHQFVHFHPKQVAAALASLYALISRAHAATTPELLYGHLAELTLLALDLAELLSRKRRVGAALAGPLPPLPPGGDRADLEAALWHLGRGVTDTLSAVSPSRDVSQAPVVAHLTALINETRHLAARLARHPDLFGPLDASAAPGVALPDLRCVLTARVQEIARLPVLRRTPWQDT